MEQALLARYAQESLIIATICHLYPQVVLLTHMCLKLYVKTSFFSPFLGLHSRHAWVISVPTHSIV